MRALDIMPLEEIQELQSCMGPDSKLLEGAMPLIDSPSDASGYMEYDDTRRPRLTLRRLNKLRKKSDARKIEMANHRDFIARMYGPMSNLTPDQRVDLEIAKMNNATDLEIERMKMLADMVVFRILCHFFIISKKEMTHDQTYFQ
ncbi:hypothetical protein, partial [uncultured Microbulbifer sp.]|uniref:hypothetical protein n=1 Tax=uncultured Microbulbifer sp. TaxID=348147 RepID=UPI002606DE41